MSNNPGRPPVGQSRAVAEQPQQLNAAEHNYLEISETLKGNNGADSRAILAMFQGDRELQRQFLAVAFSSLASNSDLLINASPMSIIQSIKDAASLGLKPDGIEGAIVRYGKVAKFMPMFQGYRKRMIRSGKVLAVDAKTVYTGDEFDYWTGPMGTEFRHHPAKTIRDDDGKAISSRGSFQGFYAYARTPEGFVYFRYLDVDQVNKIRDDHGYRDGPWKTDYEQMGLKTAIRQLQKDVPQESVAVDPLAKVERENDEAIAALRESSGRIDESLSEVRNLALRAVGAIPAEAVPSEDAAAGDSEDLRTAEGPVDRVVEEIRGAAERGELPPDPEKVYARPETETDPAKAPATTGADPGQDPNVAAAMQAAAEQEQLARQRRGQR